MDIFNDVITAQKLHDEQNEIFEDVLASKQPKIIVYENQPSLVLISAAVYKAQIERLIILAKAEKGRKEELLQRMRKPNMGMASRVQIVLSHCAKL